MRLDTTMAATTVALMTGPAFPAPTYQAVRLNDGQPLITQQTFTDVDPGFTAQGANINGPSVIRVPEWIAAGDRPDPNANYYMYFADHGGAYIRMAWAERVDGPYTLHGMHFLNENKSRGVLDMGFPRQIDLDNNIRITEHIASPDVHVNHAEQRIEMYFHGGNVKHNDANIAGNGQQTFVTFSETGLNFNAGIVPVAVGWAYLRVFDYNGERYGIGSRGSLFKAPADPFDIPQGYDFGTLLWDFEGAGNDFNDNPFQHDVDADPNGPDRLRHVAVRVTGDTLEVFHSRVGDTPERILLSTIDLTSGDFETWDPSYPSVRGTAPAGA